MPSQAKPGYCRQATQQPLVCLPGYGQVGHVVPSHIERADKPFMRRISFNQYSNEHYVAISKYEYASKWNGKPVYYNSMD